MACGNFKDLPRRTASYEILNYKVFNISKNLKFDGYQRGLASMVYKFFYKKSTLLADKYISSGAIKNENISNKELAQELHKPIIKKFKKRKVHSPFIDNIWDPDLVGIQLISKFNKGIRFLLCAIDIFSKYAVIPLKDKKRITITDAFQKMLVESNRKPNKIWIGKGSEFDNRSMKSQLEKNDKEMYSAYVEGKSVVAERFIKTLKNKIYNIKK